MTTPSLFAIHADFQLAQTLVQSFERELGADATAYRHHVLRLLNFYVGLSEAHTAPPDAVQIAAAFHDLGIWTDHRFDYLAASVRLADQYLDQECRSNLSDEVRALIEYHHQVTRYTGAHALTVECFRRADWIDVSLGVLKFGLPAPFVRQVQRRFPNAGFHARLAQLTARQFVKTPWRPLPMVRW